MKLGVIHGRFQGFHYGHLEYLCAAMDRCDFLYIGITNFDITEEKEINKADPNRFLARNNPFSYYERCEMIKAALLEKGYSLDRFCFVPFPIDSFLKIDSEQGLAIFRKRMFNFVPRTATFFMTIYDEWGKDKFEKLKMLVGEEQVDVMWRRSLSEKPISGSLLRTTIIEGKNWEGLVPPAVCKYIKDNHLDERLRLYADKKEQ